MPGVRLTCDKGVFDFHQVDAHTLLIGLDNQILSLSHTAGTMASDTSPEAAVQQLLEVHFSHEMAFTPATVSATTEPKNTHFGLIMEGTAARDLYRQMKVQGECNGTGMTGSCSTLVN